MENNIIQTVYLTELTDTNYAEFVNQPLSLVDIWAPWCKPCTQISPIIDQLSIDFVGKISVGKLNADNCPNIINELGIRGIPTILIYKNGEIVDRITGMTTKSKLSEMISKFVAE